MFKKKKEDFVCGFCGNQVMGDGFTNHCPVCLYSKHVDIDPGDRLETCCGLMKPVRIERKNKEYKIVHRCLVCGQEKLNKTQKEDSFDLILQIMAEPGS